MTMLWSALALVLLGLSGCNAPPTVMTERAAPQAVSIADTRGLRPQPKPGERVRQPELDSYCGESNRSLAFYYHGGSPVVQLARKDDCAPLYITECEPSAHCDGPRDQETGMWCCGAPGHDLPVHAER